MAVIETTRVGAAPTSVFGGLFNVLAAVSAWNNARITRKALSQLTDRELEDIGLARGDIDRITG